METVALRIFNAYGPRQSLPVSHAPVVPRFLQQALTGGSLVLYGDGGHSRDFIYVADVVEALLRAATTAGINRRVINIGSGQETTLNGLADLVEQATGRSVNRLYNPQKMGGVRRLVADIRLAQELLDFTPRVSFIDGLRRTLREDARFQARGKA